MLEDTLENQKYVEAFRSMNKHAVNADFHKVATTPAEIDFMNNANKTISKVVQTIPYKQGQFELIFGWVPLRVRAWCLRLCKTKE